MSSPFDFIDDISFHKKNLIKNSENPELAEKLYVPYLINKGLSYFPDTLLYANEMNHYNQLDTKLQNDYLINSIRASKRYAKWAKKVESDDFDAVQQYYNYNNDKTLEALSLLSSEQLSLIKQKLQKGGI